MGALRTTLNMWNSWCHRWDRRGPVAVYRYCAWCWMVQTFQKTTEIPLFSHIDKVVNVLVVQVVLVPQEQVMETIENSRFADRGEKSVRSLESSSEL